MSDTHSYASFLEELGALARRNNTIERDLYTKYDVKRGLRHADGTGVLVGLTQIGNVHGYIIDEKEKVPVEGKLSYRGIDVRDLVGGYRAEGRAGFEEIGYLLLFGELPTKGTLASFTAMLDEHRELPKGFTENMILKAPSRDVMNKLGRSVLACYSYDQNPEGAEIANVLRQSIELIARFPAMIAYGFQAKRHYHDGESLFIHNPEPGLSTAENFLRLIRPDPVYTPLEAMSLDLSLVLHAEHGGGNNSTFATHVVTSSGTDIYASIASAIGSLKGPKHGGANIKVMQMMQALQEAVADWHDEEKIAWFLSRLLAKKVFDGSGLIYGMGHAVYTLSDPRAVLLRDMAGELAVEKERQDEFELFRAVERIAPRVYQQGGHETKIIAANVDFYSGFVYQMLNIPVDLFTPVFALARISGWCAHIVEEILSGGRIIRPAYKNVTKPGHYVPLDQR
jgi:citrate synthase